MDIVYNQYTNEIGILIIINNMLLIDFDYGKTIYKVYTNNWIKVGNL